MRCMVGKGSLFDQGAVVNSYEEAIALLCTHIERDARRSAHRLTVSAAKAIDRAKEWAIYEADMNIKVGKRFYYILTLPAQ